MATRPVRASPVNKILTFRYTALSKEKKVIKGIIKASSESFANYSLVDRGLKVLNIETVEPWYSMQQMFPSMFAVKPAEITTFSRQLATLLDAGITLLAALETLQQQTGSRTFAKILRTIITDLGSGMSFSQAITKHPTVFNTIFCKTMIVSEKTGSMQQILRQLADYLEKQGVTQKKMKKALTYPAVLIGLSTIVIGILMTTALPALMNMFKTMNVVLPLPTRMLMAIANFASAYKLYILVLAIVITVSAIWLLKRPSGRARLDKFLLGMPVLGQAIHAMEIARFSRTTQVLLSAGLPLQEIMSIIPQITNNLYMKKSLERIHEHLIRGEGLSGPMSKDILFPKLLTQMVVVGEESNSLATTLDVVSRFYEETAEEKISSTISRIQPTMTIVMAIIIGWIAMAIMLPMYTLAGSMG